MSKGAMKTVIFIVIALPVGAGLFLFIYSRIRRWPRMLSLCGIVSMAVYGYLPLHIIYWAAASLTVGVLASMHFILFAIVGVVALAGELSREDGKRNIE